MKVTLSSIIFGLLIIILKVNNAQFCFFTRTNHKSQSVDWHISQRNVDCRDFSHFQVNAFIHLETRKASGFGMQTKFPFTFLLILAGDIHQNPGPLQKSNKIRLATANIRSIREKGAVLSDLVKSKHIDILAITETWLKPDDTKACVADVHHQARHSKGTRTDGGVGILISDIFRSNN